METRPEPTMCDHVAQWDGVDRREIEGIPSGCGFFKNMLFEGDDLARLGYLLAVKPGNWSAIAHVPIFDTDNFAERERRLAEWYAKLPDSEGGHACPEGQCTAEPPTNA